MSGKRQNWRIGMKPIQRGALIGLSLLTLGFLAPAVVAQANKDGQVFNDWVVRCADDPNNQARGGCFIVQNVINNVDQKPVMQIAIGYLAEDPTPAAIFTLPLGVRLPPGALIAIDDKEGVRVPFERCMPDGCKVQFRMNPDQVAAFKAGNGGKLTIQDAAGRGLAIPFSLKGFTAALNALSS